MTSTIHNLTRRLVSVRGNSGETWHLPPGGSLELPTEETAENEKISKLVANGLISIQTEEPAKPASASTRTKVDHEARRSDRLK